MAFATISVCGCCSTFLLSEAWLKIAKASGFLNASAFNTTFKRITSFTPKVWAARNELSGR